jgi:hypothetical protein
MTEMTTQYRTLLLEQAVIVGRVRGVGQREAGSQAWDKELTTPNNH